MATPSKQTLGIAKPTPASLGISTIKPMFQQYALPSKRHESFTEASAPWPDTSPVKVEDLVAAGFIYTGVADSVRCYHCGGGLRNWEPGDVPMEQHAKWYPTWEQVLIAKGKTYIHSVEAGENPEQISARKSNARASSKFTGSDLLSILMEMEDDPDLALNNSVEVEDLQSVVLENERLKYSLKCKICLDRRADIVYLPCGHIFSCQQCTDALDRCPVCRKSLMGLVKAKFA